MRKYFFRKYTFGKYTLKKYTFEKYTFKKYTFGKYTFGKYTFENTLYAIFTFHFSLRATRDWKSESVTNGPTDGHG